jgi:hypothetical protein
VGLKSGQYSLDAEASVYPIKAGNVLAITKPVRLWHRKNWKYYECNFFIWVLRESTVRKKHVLPKRRSVSVQYYYRLVLPEDGLKYFMPQSREVQFESIVRQIQRAGGGYELVATGVKYNYRLEDVAKFFNVIGVI